MDSSSVKRGWEEKNVLVPWEKIGFLGLKTKARDDSDRETANLVYQ